MPTNDNWSMDDLIAEFREEKRFNGYSERALGFVKMIEGLARRELLAGRRL